MEQADQIYRELVALATKTEQSRTAFAQRLRKVPIAERAEVITRGIDSPDQRVRRVTQALIGELGDQQWAHYAVAGLADRNAQVVQMAVWAMGELAWRDGLPALIRLVDRNYGFQVKKTLVWAFGELGDPQVGSLLVTMLQKANARLVEGILVSGLKLGHPVVVSLIEALQTEQKAVQMALRDLSRANSQFRGALLRMLNRSRRKEEVAAIRSALPYVTFYDAEYRRIVQDERETMRLAAYRSIAHSYLPQATKRTYLLDSLQDESNRVVQQSLELLLPVLAEPEVNQRVVKLARHHPSPKVQLKADQLLERASDVQKVKHQLMVGDHFLLETLPGLERYVLQEAAHREIAFEPQVLGKGWIEIRLLAGTDVKAFRALHTISRICGIISIRQDAMQGRGDHRWEQVTMGSSIYEILTLWEERTLIRPHRRLNATSLDWRVARAMVLCGQPKETDVWVDPTCGSGTLLLDRAAFGAYHSLIGGDLNHAAVQSAQMHLQQTARAHVMEWDATSLPLADQSVTTVTANLPFGRRVGDHEANLNLYPQLVREMARILINGGRAILLTQESTLLRRLLKRHSVELAIESELPIEMGGLTPHLFCVQRI